jgi:hypothetical protein
MKWRFLDNEWDKSKTDSVIKAVCFAFSVAFLQLKLIPRLVFLIITPFWAPSRARVWGVAA